MSRFEQLLLRIDWDIVCSAVWFIGVCVIFAIAASVVFR